MKLRILGLVLALVLCLCSMAAADTAIVSTIDLNVRDIVFNSAANTMAVMQENADVYEIMDANGNVLSEGKYGQVFVKDGMYRVSNENTLNNYGLLDGNGKEMMPMAYGDVIVLSDRWQVGVKLVKATAENYDYKTLGGSERYYLVGQNDVYFDGVLVGSLDRLQFSGTQAYALGEYLYVKQKEGGARYYDKTLTPSGYDKTGGTYYEEFEYDRKTKAVWHKGSNQKAFCEGCTLTEDEVLQTVWVQDDAIAYDLQGNVLFDLTKRNYDYIYKFKGDYASVKINKLYGLIDKNGNEVLPCDYNNLYPTDDGYFANGYLIVEKDGKLGMVDPTGKELVEYKYAMSNCNTYRAPFAYLKDMEGKHLVISPVAGELPTRYEEINMSMSGKCPVFVAKVEEDKVALVDLYGNEVIPADGTYDRTYDLEFSADGTVVVGKVDYHEYKVYTLSHEAAQAAEPAGQTGGAFDALMQIAGSSETATAGGQTACTGCGYMPPEGQTPKFCSECGTPFPKKLVCSGCGFEPAEGTTPKFCSECGTAF